MDMERLCGFSEKGYYFEVQIPTTIYDPQKVVIVAYEEDGGKRKDEVERIHIPLKKMPKWDIPAQDIFLSKRDNSKLEKLTKKFIDSLPARGLWKE